MADTGHNQPPPNANQHMLPVDGDEFNTIVDAVRRLPGVTAGYFSGTLGYDEATAEALLSAMQDREIVSTEPRKGSGLFSIIDETQHRPTSLPVHLGRTALRQVGEFGAHNRRYFGEVWGNRLNRLTFGALRRARARREPQAARPPASPQTPVIVGETAVEKRARELRETQEAMHAQQLAAERRRIQEDRQRHFQTLARQQEAIDMAARQTEATQAAASEAQRLAAEAAQRAAEQQAAAERLATDARNHAEQLAAQQLAANAASTAALQEAILLAEARRQQHANDLEQQRIIREQARAAEAARQAPPPAAPATPPPSSAKPATPERHIVDAEIVEDTVVDDAHVADSRKDKDSNTNPQLRPPLELGS